MNQPVDAPAPASPGRVPPHNIEAEASLLGAMLLTTDAIVDASQIVDASHFYKPVHQSIFAAVRSLYDRGEAVDVVTVSDELARAGVDASVAGTGALMSLSAGTPAATNASHYARIVYDHAVLRKLITTSHDIAEIAYGQPDDVTKAVDEAETLVFNVAQGRVSDSMAFMHDLLGETLDDIEQLYDRGDAITGTPTGFTDLDRLTAGLQPSNLVIVGARPAMGKTSFALGMVAHAAMVERRPVLMFSLEMSKLELSKRMLCSEAKVDATNIRNGRLKDDDWTKLAQAMGRLGDAQLWIDDDPTITVMDIRAKARRLKSKVGDLGMIVIDYLQLMTGRTSAENRQVEVSEISRGLKILARELECPVVALSQLSRSLELRADKRPMLADLRESGAIEQDADVVMFLYRDDVYNPDSADMGQAEVIIAKHRAGPTGVVRLAWLPHYTRFANMARNN
ncbi:MAG: replicative DNA helicase [Actinomycetota bacterium]